MIEQELQKNLQEYTELAKKEGESDSNYTERVSNILYSMLQTYEKKLRKMQRRSA